MPESESEDEILDRIEEALRKIAGATRSVKRPPSQEGGLDREELAAVLDKLILRLREGLDPSQMHVTE